MTEPFIVTGMGHSGTKFVAELFKLNHEKFLSSEQVVKEALGNELYAVDLIKGMPQDTRESNSFLAPLVKFIKRQFPSATLIQLVRNPKLVVPSILNTNPGTIESVSGDWLRINKSLREQGLPFLRIEDLGGVPVNKHGDCLRFEDWEKEQKELLLSICQEEMSYYGY